MIGPDTPQYVILRNMLILRRERRFNRSEFAIFTLRFMMLNSALKLPLAKYLDPVFIAGCGLGQSTLACFKALKGKKPYFKLTMEDIGNKKA